MPRTQPAPVALEPLLVFGAARSAILAASISGLGVVRCDRRVRTPVHPRAGSGGWSSWTILKLKAEARNAGRLDPRPNPFEAAEPIKLPALSGEPRLPSGEPAAGVGDQSGAKPHPGVARNAPPKPPRGRGRQRPRHAIFFQCWRGSGSSRYLLRLADCHSQARWDDRFGSSRGHLLKVTPKGRLLNR